MGGHTFRVADAEWESAQRIVQAALDHFGRIDCIINNAGITRDRFFFNMSLEEWRTVLDVQLNGSFFTARAAAPHFKGQGSGCFVHRMEGNKIPPLAVYLASNSGEKVSGQIFGVRANEIYLFSQPRILRTLHRAEGWTPESIGEHAIPALESSFYENVPSMAITPWDPI
jgi:hypothetical protein